MSRISTRVNWFWYNWTRVKTQKCGFAFLNKQQNKGKACGKKIKSTCKKSEVKIFSSVLFVSVTGWSDGAQCDTSL